MMRSCNINIIPELSFQDKEKKKSTDIPQHDLLFETVNRGTTDYLKCSPLSALTGRSPLTPMSTAGSATRAPWCRTGTATVGTVPTVSSTMAFKRYCRPTHSDKIYVFKSMRGASVSQEKYRTVMGNEMRRENEKEMNGNTLLM